MKKGFSLIELLISLIIISIITAALAPVISKKLKNSSISLSQMNEITTECSNSSNYGEKCELCTKKYCIKCALESCTTGTYPKTKTCSCEDCKTGYPDSYGNQCIECDDKGCTLCASSQYYIKDGKCEKCPQGHYCNGKDDYATCPGNGYYCDSTGIHKCTDTHNSYCTTCSATACLSCEHNYYPSGTQCLPCNIDGCWVCTSNTKCIQCNDRLLLSNGTCGDACYKLIPNCKNCSSSTVCISCLSAKYYLSSSGTCPECNISNCIKCANGQSASSPKCTSCEGGYYLNSSGTCSTCASKYGTNCAACTAAECASCNIGYHLSSSPSSKSACEADTTAFSCSDSNFMQIGKLCVTRKNMGDSSLLKIPTSVTIAAAGTDGDYCHSITQKCCWQGKTTPTCDAASGSYDACNRTVCNLSAAKEICANFNYAGKIWRLPTTTEMQNWYAYSAGLGNNGLQLCDRIKGTLSSQCYWGSGLCRGADARNWCEPAYLRASNGLGMLYSLNWSVVNSLAVSGQDSVYAGESVRCVTEMD